MSLITSTNTNSFRFGTCLERRRQSYCALSSTHFSPTLSLEVDSATKNSAFSLLLLLFWSILMHSSECWVIFMLSLSFFELALFRVSYNHHMFLKSRTLCAANTGAWRTHTHTHVWIRNQKTAPHCGPRMKWNVSAVRRHHITFRFAVQSGWLDIQRRTQKKRICYFSLISFSVSNYLSATYLSLCLGLCIDLHQVVEVQENRRNQIFASPILYIILI